MNGNASSASGRTKLMVVLLLALVTAGVYLPVTGFDFTNYDDPDYVTYNPMVQQGVTRASVEWAFTTDHASNWHPLTWISHMVDCELYGLKPGRHHLTNLLFHTANTVLVFLVLEGLTGAMWRSALVAALFGWHPLHVESVAWISERKDVLSTFFWLLTMAAYGKYAIESKGARAGPPGGKSKVFYILALFFFLMGLLSKPMLVTLPFVLLLMDYWPLTRISDCGFRIAESGTKARKLLIALLLEKVPFLALAGLECAATVWAQKAAHSVVSLAALPVGDRVGNALVSYVFYLSKTFWPVNLAVPYPYSQEWTFGQAAGAGALLVLITAGVIWQRRERPYLAMGWLWFLGTLAPVIGLVQVGIQFMADRYTYVPLIGIFIMVAWSVPAAWTAWPRPGQSFGMGMALLLIALLMATSVQLLYWRNSVALFAHTTAVTENNILAEYNLAEALARAGNDDAAVEVYLKTLAMQPNRVEAQYNSQQQAHFNLGLIYRKEGKWPEAEAQFRACLREDPRLANAHHALGSVLLAMGRTGEGIAEEKEAARLEPDDAQALSRVAWLLATESDAKLRDGAEAVRLAERARDLTNGRDARILASLDAAYAEAGRLTDAIAGAQRTIATAQAQGLKDVASAAEGRLKLYQAGKAYRE